MTDHKARKLAQRRHQLTRAAQKRAWQQEHGVRR